MTERQLKYFYFKLWNGACSSNDWRMQKGRLVGKRAASFGPPDIDLLYQTVWKLAADCAAQVHRAITPDDLRHACHRAALGHDKSAKDLTNKELDRVGALFRILRDPEDLDAVLDFLHPENQERARLLYAIEQSPDGVARAISERMFSTREWRDLDTAQLRDLLGPLRRWQTRWNETHPAAVDNQLTTENSLSEDPF